MIRMPLPRTLTVGLAIFPFIVSFLRDWHSFVFFGPPRRLSEADHMHRAARLRERMGQLGPTFIKGAQVLAMREDIIPPAYARELRQLQDRVPPFPVAQVREILARSYGLPADQVFEHFDPEPLAAASIGQVHRATYRGRDVVLKILRPGVEELVRTDLRVVFFFVGLFQVFVDNNVVRSFTAIVQEYQRMVGEEMDLRTEHDNANRLRRNFRDNPRIHIPEFVEELVSREAVVIEYVDGVRVDDEAGIRARGVTPDELVDLLIENYVRMAVVHGFIHADPHPGNLMIDGQKRLVILDYGMALEFDENTRLELLRMVYAVTRKDVDTIVDGFYKLGMVDGDINRSVLRDAAQKLLDIQLNTDVTTKQMQKIAQDILDTFYKFPLRLPNKLVYLLRASTLVEGIALYYNPRFNSVKAATPVVKKMLREIAFSGDKSIKDRVVDGAQEAVVTVKELAVIIHRLEREQLQLRLHQADMFEIQRFMMGFLRRLLGTLGLCTLTVVAIIAGPPSKLYAVSILLLAGALLAVLVAVPLSRRR